MITPNSQSRRSKRREFVSSNPERDREVRQAQKLAEGLSERCARDIQANARDFTFVEVYAAQIALGR